MTARASMIQGTGSDVGKSLLVAGLALMAPLANALSIALGDERERMAATTAFAVTASGLTLFGIGAAFWGLVAGMIVIAVERLKKS